MMSQQPCSSRPRQAGAEHQINVDPFLLEMNRVSHSSNAIELRIIRKKAEIKNHRRKLCNIEDRIKKLYKQKKTTEGELFVAKMDLNVLQEGLENGSDSD